MVIDSYLKKICPNVGDLLILLHDYSDILKISEGVGAGLAYLIANLGSSENYSQLAGALVASCSTKI